MFAKRMRNKMKQKLKHQLIIYKQKKKLIKILNPS